MSATAFQRRRREAKRKAEQEAKKAQEVEDHNQYDDPVEQVSEPVDEVSLDQAENEQTAPDGLDDATIDKMDKDELHAALKERGINKPSNTGEKKLREALKDAIK